MSDTPETDKYTGLGYNFVKLSETSRRLERERDAYKAQRDGLAVALQRIAEYGPDNSSGDALAYIAKEALAAVKGEQP